MYLAQIGGRYRDSKPLLGSGPGAVEVITDIGGNTFRTIYTVRFSLAVYVLHTFQKKSKKGVATLLSEITWSDAV